MRIGLFIRTQGDRPGALDAMVAEAKETEARGFPFLLVPNIFGLDAIGACTVIGRETERLELVTGVVPSPPRHPVAMAQQALTAQAAAGGRFTLGIGLSHKLVIEDMLGLSYARPAAQMREYLEALVPLCQGQQAKLEGEFLRVNAQLQVPDGTPVPVMVAALGPRMLKLTGELAAGTITWMTGPMPLETLTVPTINAAARAAGRDAPRVLAALPVAVTRDVDAARALAAKLFAVYGMLPSYRAMLDREGAAGPADVVLAGDEAEVRGSLDRMRNAGVTDFAGIAFPADEGCVARTTDFLHGEL